MKLNRYLAAAAIVPLGWSATAHAALDEPAAAAAWDVVAQDMAETAAPAPAAAPAADWPMEQAQGVSHVLELTSAPQLTLWYFVATVQAQKQSRPLDLVQANLKIVEAVSAVAPVPLPNAAGMLLIGLLGIAGVRIAGRAGPGHTAPRLAGV